METRTAARRHESPPNAIAIAIGGAVALALTALAVPSGPSRSPAPGTGNPPDVGIPVAAFAATVEGFRCGAAPGPRADRATGASAGGADRASDRLAALRVALDEPGSLVRRGGDGTRIECRGGGSPEASAIAWHFDLERLELVRTLDGERQLNAFESRHTVVAPREARLVAGSIVAETVSLPPASAWTASPGGDALVAASSARRAGAAARCRTSLVGRCTVALDIGWRASITGRGIALEQTFWVNGRAAEHVLWRLGG